MSWIEQGSNPTCEDTLGIRRDKPTLIAFRHGGTRYERFQEKFSVEKVKEFILKVKGQDSALTKFLPADGVKLIGI